MKNQWCTQLTVDQNEYKTRAKKKHNVDVHSTFCLQLDSIHNEIKQNLDSKQLINVAFA